MSATVYVARHGETTWNLAGRYQGRLESDLSDLGIGQAQALAGYFADRLAAGEPVPTRILSSPLRRCIETAAFTAALLGIAVETDARLIEIAHGTWEGRYRDEIAANDPPRYDAWRNDPEEVAFEGGESLGDVRARWHDFAGTLEETKKDLLVVTHDAIARVAVLGATRRPLRDFWKVHVENGAFARYARHDGAIAILEECHTAHLGDLRALLEGQAL